MRPNLFHRFSEHIPDITRFALVGSSVGEIIQRGLRDVNWFVNVRMLWFVEKLGVHGEELL